MDKGREWVEGGILDFKRVIQTYDHVFWTN